MDQTTSTGSYIHYNPSRVDYSVSEDELIRLRDAGRNLSKDVCLVSFSIGLPCLINAIADTKDPFILTIGVLLNYLIGVVGIGFSLVSALAWYRSYINSADVIASIKNKPVMKLEAAQTEGTARLVRIDESGNNQPIEHKDEAE